MVRGNRNRLNIPLRCCTPYLFPCFILPALQSFIGWNQQLLFLLQQICFGKGKGSNILFGFQCMALLHGLCINYGNLFPILSKQPGSIFRDNQISVNLFQSVKCFGRTERSTHTCRRLVCTNRLGQRIDRIRIDQSPVICVCRKRLQCFLNRSHRITLIQQIHCFLCQILRLAQHRLSVLVAQAAGLLQRINGKSCNNSHDQCGCHCHTTAEICFFPIPQHSIWNPQHRCRNTVNGIFFQFPPNLPPGCSPCICCQHFIMANICPFLQGGRKGFCRFPGGKDRQNM